MLPSSILLGLESSCARASALARQEIIHGRRISPEKSIRHLQVVTPDDLLAVARKYFTSETLALGALGNFNGFRVDRLAFFHSRYSGAGRSSCQFGSGCC